MAFLRPVGRVPHPPPVIPQPVASVGRLRKIALIGSAPTVDLAPWYDPSWEIWAHATVYPYCKRVDRYFDLHPWKWISEKPMPGYLEWLKRCGADASGGYNGNATKDYRSAGAQDPSAVSSPALEAAGQGAMRASKVASSAPRRWAMAVMPMW